MPQRITLLGAGSWGTALALVAARNNCQVMLWGHEPTHIEAIAKSRVNQRFLPGIALPDTITLTSSLEQAAAFSNLILVIVPSHAFRQTLVNLKPFISRHDLQIAWATKGFDPEDGGLLHQIIAEVFTPEIPAAILSGPTFAREVAMQLPTAITVAANNLAFAKQLAAIFHSDRFRAYTSTDVIGVEVGGAVKNVLAIAAGIADGLGFGANTRAALITRGLSEIMRLGIKLGGKSETFTGLTGLGDLVLTCTDNQSRNRRFGLALGAGKQKIDILTEIGQEVEGISAARETFALAKKHDIDMPIIEQTYKVLYEDLPALYAVQNLLARNQKAEI
jgi:glycerol-3-phosphate dehydrogenase (NAD(P)+)